ncbi:hypothetical protein H0A36_25765 [Endozoicomonas sp. SM1973]|uniref:Uncharacterized protein n=2 Tax=Spartinivicinus marinus TaxID=2994442 RepID=A0A853IJ48_9GAMM|nr:hypothetical protein [Spartinivicinus marinus]NYZ69427.1 hypothetical protein [Spartinivicinus marinus]
MPKPSIQVNERNFLDILGYLNNHIGNHNWSQRFELSSEIHDSQPVLQAIVPVAEAEQVNKLQAWCDEWLDAKNNSQAWQKVKRAVYLKYKQVDCRESDHRVISTPLEARAHLILSSIAGHKTMSMSDVIEKYLGPVQKRLG